MLEWWNLFLNDIEVFASTMILLPFIVFLSVATYRITKG
jgi:hypothetical protein